jgi:hypothetical protein
MQAAKLARPLVRKSPDLPTFEMPQAGVRDRSCGLKNKDALP